MRRESEGRLRLDGRSVSNEWQVRSRRGEEEWRPQHHFPSTREQKGTEPQNSGRICGEEVRGVNTALKELGCCGAEEVVEATYLQGTIRNVTIRTRIYRFGKGQTSICFLNKRLRGHIGPDILGALQDQGYKEEER